MKDQDIMTDYNDYRHEYDGYDDGPVDPLYIEFDSNLVNDQT